MEIAPGRFELPSEPPKGSMLDRYIPQNFA